MQALRCQGVEPVTVAAILLLGAVLLAVSTWSKRRLMIRLLAVVEDGEAMTSWLASASEVRGVVDGRDVRIENVATTRGVLKISVEHRSSTRAKAFRRTRLRAGNRTSLAFPNGVTSTSSYDTRNRLTSLSTATSVGDVVQAYQYTLGLSGHRTRVDEHDGTSSQYGYDALYRLTQERVTDPADALVYQKDLTYDPVGNRLSEGTTDENGTTSVASAYDSRDRLLSAGAVTYGYDDNGNLTAAQTGGATTTYDWDFERRLTRVVLEDATVVETVYDADGNRVRTTTTPGSGAAATVDYLVDTTGSLSHVVAEVVGGQVETLYTRAGDRLLSLYRPGGDTRRFYHADVLGSVRALTDETGTVTDRYTFEAFGELIDHQGQDPNPYLFAGEALERSTGLYYLRARWMDPGAGRLAGMDPFAGLVSEPMTLHPFLYAAADPVNKTDPSGRFSVGVGVGLGTMSISAMSILKSPHGGPKGRRGTLDCPHGRPPAKIEVIQVTRNFPGLASGNFRVTAPRDKEYNCIAWSVKNTTIWVWWHVDDAGDKDGKVEVSDFKAFYKRFGLKRVRSRAKAEVVLYSRFGEPTHASRRHPCSSRHRLYESKLGAYLRVVHKRGALRGPLYGYRIRYFGLIEEGGE